MARVVIAGRAFDLAPYKLGALRQASAYIDRINASQGALSTVEGMVAAAGDFLGVLSVGISRIDPAMTLAALEEIVGIDDIPALRDGFMEVLAESGLVAGEAPAPVLAGEPDASTTPSAPSSAN